ncbi:substrate-binding periplasmic protein [Neptuniibacter caesariensis]|uniref:Solute-binding protein family 3/N-terminal domain-containing protein n=1 Tax=Neptuniibacter caesariensis TaxID=207954 RepID=A0A7U8C396_NEPCE|nr:hypothetical protein [Neptuniibacter caesariensis]EAR60690.1 hypothetical protein MED92_13483 [Neptuniibacter caesariensis]
MRTLFLIGTLLLTTVKAEAETVIEVLAVEYPPFTTAKVTGNGLSFRLLKQHLKEVDKLSLEPLFLPPARLQQRIKSNNWCFSFYPVGKAVESKFVALADRTFRIGLFFKEDDPNLHWQSLEQLAGYRVAILRSDRSSQLYDRFIKAGLSPVFVDEVEQGLKMLQLNRVDAALGDEHLRNFVGLGLNNLEGIKFADTPLFETQIGVFVNLNCPHADLL